MSTPTLIHPRADSMPVGPDPVTAAPMPVPAPAPAPAAAPGTAPTPTPTPQIAAAPTAPLAAIATATAVATAATRPSVAPRRARAAQAERERDALATAAAGALTGCGVVGLFGGAGVEALARLLRPESGMTVVTNSLRVARAMDDGPVPRFPSVIVINGIVHSEGVMVGPDAMRTLSGLRLDAAVFDCAGFERGAGATVADLEDSRIRRVAVASARRRLVLVESAACGVVALSKFAASREVDLVLGVASRARSRDRAYATTRQSHEFAGARDFVLVDA